jgi:periplasmic protein TonB
MLGGFDPRTQSLFFERRRSAAMLAALLLYASVLGWALRDRGHGPTLDVQLEPEIKDFAVEQEPEPEIEEEEPPPPPPPDVEVKVVQKPKPAPRVAPPDKKVTEAPEESDKAKAIEVPAGPTSPGGQGERPVKAKPDKPSKAPEPKPEPPPEPKAKAPSIDPTQPIDRPENATMPTPEADNAQPEYPAELRDKGITGEVVLKVHIHRDGSVRGAKILRKKNSATTDEEKALADKLFVAAVIKVVKNWKYTPAKLNGQPISIWFPVTFPFKLTAG